MFWLEIQLNAKLSNLTELRFSFESFEVPVHYFGLTNIIGQLRWYWGFTKTK